MVGFKTVIVRGDVGDYDCKFTVEVSYEIDPDRGFFILRDEPKYLEVFDAETGSDKAFFKTGIEDIV